MHGFLRQTALHRFPFLRTFINGDLPLIFTLTSCPLSVLSFLSVCLLLSVSLFVCMSVCICPSVTVCLSFAVHLFVSVHVPVFKCLNISTSLSGYMSDSLFLSFS